MYEAVIGLEVHAHLATSSKLFCSCSNRFGAPPNTNVCEICSAMPGALPTPNREAIRLAALLGLASNCSINKKSVFARKNYFYPDLPAGYQISQYDLPICEHGFLEIDTPDGPKKIGITRIHLENDAGKNIHSAAENLSFVDLNRAGAPLVEIVSEPDMRSAQEAALYLRTLHSLITYLGISDGNMEEGSFRCDANISLRPKGVTKFGIRAELKNLNSFRNVQHAIEYEILRQRELLEEGKEVIQETRLYDADKNVTHVMRGKEDAQDYRYFPDPDLMPLEISGEELKKLADSIPELPRVRLKRFMEMTGLPQGEVEILVQNRPLADFFDMAASLSDARKAASWLIGPAMRICNAENIAPNPEGWKFTPENLANLIKIVKEGAISAKIASDIFPALFASGINPEQYIQDKGLSQISDSSALETVVAKIIENNPKEAAAYKGGKTKLLSFFVGQVMRETKGKANPGLVNDLIKKYLG